LIAEYNVAEKMAKLILYVFIALLAASLIMGAPDKCGRHGDPVSIHILVHVFLIKPLLLFHTDFFKIHDTAIINRRKMRKMILPFS